MKTSVEIPLNKKIIGVDGKWNREIKEKIVLGMNEQNRLLTDIVSSIIGVHKLNYVDKRHLRDVFSGMNLEMKKNKRGLSLVCHNVPSQELYDQKGIYKMQEQQISSAIRDVILCPPLPSEDAKAEEISKYVKEFVSRTGLLSRKGKRNICFVWGGHKLPNQDKYGHSPEYEYAKEVAYHDVMRFLTEYNTGSGSATMKAAVRSAMAAYHQRIFRNKRNFVGFTDIGILSAEVPNGIIDRLIIFPNLEYRKEGFIRFSHRGRAHPGGIGTLDEICTCLGVKIHEKNKGLCYPFDLVEGPDGEYFRKVQEFFRICFKDALDDLYHLHVGNPSEYIDYVKKTYNPQPQKSMWNDDLYYPNELQKSSHVTFESIESIDLSLNNDAFGLLVNLQKFFSFLVDIIVKNPEIKNAWGGDLPLIKGDKKILQASDELVNWFVKNKRTFGDNYERPYRIE